MRAALRNLLQRNRSFYLGYLLFLVGGTLWLALVGKEPLFLQMNAWQHPWLDASFPMLTHLGDGLFALLFLLGFLLYNYRLTLTALVCFVGVLLLTQLGKTVLFPDALRPFAYFQALGQSIRLIEGVQVHSNHSFPSGHSAAIFALCAFLALQLPAKKWGLPLLLTALLIAFTRVYLAQHFWGDLLAGSLLGVATVTVGTALMDRWFAAHPASWQERGLLRGPKASSRPTPAP